MVDEASDPSNNCSVAPFFPDTLGTGCCGDDPCAFAGVQSDGYWSSATIASGPSNAFIAFLSNGSVGGNGKASNGFVWPVRAGP